MSTIIINLIGIVITIVLLEWVRSKLAAYVMKDTGLTYIPKKTDTVLLMASVGTISVVFALAAQTIKGILYLLTM